MGVPNVVYKWSSLRVLYVTVFVMNVAGFVIVVIMIVSAIRLKTGFGTYLNLVTPGDGHLWPALTIIAAIICAPIYAVGIRLCFRLKFLRPSNDLPQLNQHLFVLSVLCFASVFLLNGINAVCIFQSSSFRHGIHDGFAEAMRDYATETVAKIRVDMIQIKFRCCGSKSYKEWFFIPWLQMDDGEDTEDRETYNSSRFISADVPFSCCSTELLKPCIHHNILRSSDVYDYEPEHRLTITTTGCQAKILAHANGLGNFLIGTLFLLSGYQMLLSLLSRLLQTAHSNSFYFGPKKSHYLSWILGRMPSREVYNNLVFKNEAVPEEEVARSLGSAAEKTTSGWKNKADDGCRKVKTKLLQKIYSNMTTRTKSVDVVGTSSALEEEGKLPLLSIPTPPPSPDSLRADESEEKDVCSSSNIERESSEGSPLLGEKSDSILSFKTRRGSDDQISIKRLSRGSREKMKELRASLQHINDLQSPWNEGSPVFEKPQANHSNEHSRFDQEKLEMGRQKRMQEGKPFREDMARPNLQGRETSMSRDSVHGEETPRSLPQRRRDRRRPSRDPEGIGSESRSSQGHRGCLCRKESVDKDELRIKKFCKDLSAEYNESPCSKQRKEYSENYRWQDRAQTWQHNAEDNKDIRTQVCAKFNPADMYSRFRGSTQDTMMRRPNQLQMARPSLSPVPERGPAVRRWSQLYQGNVPFAPQAPMAPTQMWAQQQTSWGPYCPPSSAGYFPQHQRQPDYSSVLRRTSYNGAYHCAPYQEFGQMRPMIGPNEVQRPRCPARCPMTPNIGEPSRFCGL